MKISFCLVLWCCLLSLCQIVMSSSQWGGETNYGWMKLGTVQFNYSMSFHSEEQRNEATLCLMNSTLVTDNTVIRHIVQNVTEHFQEDEKDSLLLAYAIVALVICLILSSVVTMSNEA